jgi:hypothetical protein
VPVALGELIERVGIERQQAAGIDDIDPVLLVDRLTPHDGPQSRPPIERFSKNS